LGFEYRLNRIDALRSKQAKNMAALLMMSRGVPMLLAGDECGRSQSGNNNAYCQDNEISWFDWDLVEQNRELNRFFRLLIDYRRRHPALRRDSFHDTQSVSRYPITFHGVQCGQPDHSFTSRTVAVQFDEHPERSSIYVVTNAWWEPLRFELPPLSDGRRWCLKADTSADSPFDILERDSERPLGNQDSYLVAPRSVIILTGL
jgi:glycogen operon protein